MRTRQRFDEELTRRDDNFVSASPDGTNIIREVGPQLILSAFAHTLNLDCGCLLPFQIKTFCIKIIAAIWIENTQIVVDKLGEHILGEVTVAFHWENYVVT